MRVLSQQGVYFRESVWNVSGYDVGLHLVLFSYMRTLFLHSDLLW